MAGRVAARGPSSDLPCAETGDPATARRRRSGCEHKRFKLLDLPRAVKKSPALAAAGFPGDVEGDNVRVVAAYRTDAGEWKDDFLGGTLAICEDAADVEDLGSVELTDAVYLLNHLPLGGAAPPAPDCGG